MKHWIKPMAAAVALAGCALMTQQSQAGCSFTNNSKGLKPTVYLNDGRGGMLKTDFGQNGPFNTSSISGVYQFKWWAAIGPGGINVLVDSGFITFHDDGTEVNVSARAPVTGDVCVGVWEQTGWTTFEVNHWGLSWVTDAPNPSDFTSNIDGNDSTNNAFVFAGPANILESLVLAKDGNSLTGHFNLTQYLPAPATSTDPFPPAFDTSGGVAPNGTLEGTIQACRIVPGKVQPPCPFWKVAQ
jgi:hypothetical protein